MKAVRCGALVAIVMVVALALVASGCGSGSSSSGGSTASGGTVTLWHGYTDVERAAVDSMGPEYNATDPAWKVKIVFSGNNDYGLQKLLTALAAGKAPDMMYQYGSSLANLSRSPKIVNMGDLIAKTPGFDWNDFYEAERLACTVNGNVMALPALVDNLCLVYNKKLFDQAGLAYPTADWTWDDFRSAAAKLTDPSAKQYGWAYVNDGSEDTVWRYLALLWQAGGDLLNADNTKAAFDSPAGLASMTLLHDMAVVDKSVYLDSGNQNYLNLFNNGKIAMLWTGPWDMSSVNKGVDYGVQILPAGSAGHETIAGPDDYVTIDNGAGPVQGSWDFLQWFTSPKVHLQFAIATGDLPIRESETKLPAYKTYIARYPYAKIFVDNLSNVTKARPNIPQYPKISIALGQAVQGVLLGKLQPQAALDQASQQVDTILAAPAP
ncbi:MAG TPA: ABC transporter substrate-binding protein [Thermoleophilia bacterium]|nr:ABC transporter substrate-binding protein [Thermoleophilia bacterium]